MHNNCDISTLKIYSLTTVWQTPDLIYRFHIPKKDALPNVKVEGEDAAKECLYFSSLNLGLKPKEADSAVQTQLEKWGLLYVVLLPS